MKLETKLRVQSLFQRLKSQGQAPSDLCLIDESFEKQAAFLKDPSRLKAALCTRRAGKTYGAATLMFDTAMRRPGSTVLYIALTRDSAKKIMWRDCIKVINKKHKLSCKFNETELTATLPNGSVLYLTGADAKPDEMDKLLGQKYPLVIIDEAASWKQDVEKLVYGILKPAVADYNGTIIMIGTPGNITKSFYKDVTDGKINGWSIHKWTAFDNPYMKQQWAAEIEDLKASRPGIEKTPLFKQMYLGEWFVDESKLVYRFSSSNVVDRLPELPGRLTYILGVDTGYHDASAFSLTCFSEHDQCLYVVKTHKKTKMLISDLAERIRDFTESYDISYVVADPANKQAIEEIKQRYNIPIRSAEKASKAEFIEIMNSDFVTGNIKLLNEHTKELQAEYEALVWDESSMKREEHPACENHLADATLYAWRYAYNYLARPIEKPVSIYSEQYMENFWQREAEGRGKTRNVLDEI